MSRTIRTSDERRRCGSVDRAVATPSYAGDIVGLDHQDQHQSVLRQDEGRLRGQSQGTRPHPAGLRRQGRRRQRRRGQGDRAADRRRRQGHPAGAERLDGDRADGEEGARRRHHRHHARHAARSGRRRRRAVRHRQLQGRRTDRPVGQGHARRQGGQRQDRHARPDGQPAVRRLSAPQRLPHRLRHHGEGSQAFRDERQPADRRLRR